MSPLLLEILGSVVRTAAAALSGYLVTHHMLTASDRDRFTAELNVFNVTATSKVGQILQWVVELSA